MTEDIILSVTAGFIQSSQSNLKLALQVERAMPYVREHFVRAILEAIEKCFPRSEWTIDRSGIQDVMAKNAGLSLRSSAWSKYQAKASIWLSSDKPDWKNVWFGLYFTGRSWRKFESVEQTMAPLTNSGYAVDEADKDAPGVFKYFDRELRDWSEEQFLARILEDGPDRIASEISSELKEIDEFVRSLPRARRARKHRPGA